MSNEEQTRRGFLKGAGLVASSVLGATVGPEAAPAQAQGQTGTTQMSKAARFRAALVDDAGRWRLPREVSARLINQAEWISRAQKYGVIR